MLQSFVQATPSLPGSGGMPTVRLWTSRSIRITNGRASPWVVQTANQCNHSTNGEDDMLGQQPSMALDDSQGASSMPNNRLGVAQGVQVLRLLQNYPGLDLERMYSLLQRSPSWSGTRSQLAALLSQLIQEGRAHEDNGIFKYQRSPSPAADRHTSMLGQQPTQHAPSTAAQGSTFDQHSTVQATPESTQSQAQTPLPALEAVDQHPAPAAEPAAVASTKQAGSAEGGSSRDSSPSGSPSGSPSRSERMSLVAKRTHALRRLRKEFESGKLGPEEFEEKAAAIEAQYAALLGPSQPASSRSKRSPARSPCVGREETAETTQRRIRARRSAASSAKSSSPASSAAGLSPSSSPPPVVVPDASQLPQQQAQQQAASGGPATKPQSPQRDPMEQLHVPPRPPSRRAGSTPGAPRGIIQKLRRELTPGPPEDEVQAARQANGPGAPSSSAPGLGSILGLPLLGSKPKAGGKGGLPWLRNLEPSAADEQSQLDVTATQQLPQQQVSPGAGPAQSEPQVQELPAAADGSTDVAWSSSPSPSPAPRSPSPYPSPSELASSLARIRAELQASAGNPGDVRRKLRVLQDLMWQVQAVVVDLEAQREGFERQPEPQRGRSLFELEHSRRVLAQVCSVLAAYGELPAEDYISTMYPPDFGTPAPPPMPARGSTQAPANMWGSQAGQQDTQPPASDEGPVHQGPPGCLVKLTVPCQVSYGEVIKVTGDRAELGAWSITRALPMIWTLRDVWCAELRLRPGRYEIKAFVDVSNGRAQRWEDGGNKIIEVPEGAVRLTAAWQWSSPLLDIQLEWQEGCSQQQAQERGARQADMRPYDAGSSISSVWDSLASVPQPQPSTNSSNRTYSLPAVGVPNLAISLPVTGVWDAVLSGTTLAQMAQPPASYTGQSDAHAASDSMDQASAAPGMSDASASTSHSLTQTDTAGPAGLTGATGQADTGQDQGRDRSPDRTIHSPWLQAGWNALEPSAGFELPTAFVDPEPYNFSTASFDYGALLRVPDYRMVSTADRLMQGKKTDPTAIPPPSVPSAAAQPGDKPYDSSDGLDGDDAEHAEAAWLAAAAVVASERDAHSARRAAAATEAARRAQTRAQQAAAEERAAAERRAAAIALVAAEREAAEALLDQQQATSMLLQHGAASLHGNGLQGLQGAEADGKGDEEENGQPQDPGEWRRILAAQMLGELKKLGDELSAGVISRAEFDRQSVELRQQWEQQVLSGPAAGTTAAAGKEGRAPSSGSSFASPGPVSSIQSFQLSISAEGENEDEEEQEEGEAPRATAAQMLAVLKQLSEQLRAGTISRAEHDHKCDALRQQWDTLVLRGSSQQPVNQQASAMTSYSMAAPLAATNGFSDGDVSSSSSSSWDWLYNLLDTQESSSSGVGPSTADGAALRAAASGSSFSAKSLAASAKAIFDAAARAGRDPWAAVMSTLDIELEAGGQEGPVLGVPSGLVAASAATAISSGATAAATAGASAATAAAVAAVALSSHPLPDQASQYSYSPSSDDEEEEEEELSQESELPSNVLELPGYSPFGSGADPDQAIEAALAAIQRERAAAEKEAWAKAKSGLSPSAGSAGPTAGATSAAPAPTTAQAYGMAPGSASGSSAPASGFTTDDEEQWALQVQDGASSQLAWDNNDEDEDEGPLFSKFPQLEPLPEPPEPADPEDESGLTFSMSHRSSSASQAGGSFNQPVSPLGIPVPPEIQALRPGAIFSMDVLQTALAQAGVINRVPRESLMGGWNPWAKQGQRCAWLLGRGAGRSSVDVTASVRVTASAVGTVVVAGGATGPDLSYDKDNTADVPDGREGGTDGREEDPDGGWSPFSATGSQPDGSGMDGDGGWGPESSGLVAAGSFAVSAGAAGGVPDIVQEVRQVAQLMAQSMVEQVQELQSLETPPTSAMSNGTAGLVGAAAAAMPHAPKKAKNGRAVAGDRRSPTVGREEGMPNNQQPQLQAQAQYQAQPQPHNLPYVVQQGRSPSPEPRLEGQAQQQGRMGGMRKVATARPQSVAAAAASSAATAASSTFVAASSTAAAASSTVSSTAGTQVQPVTARDMYGYGSETGQRDAAGSLHDDGEGEEGEEEDEGEEQFERVSRGRSYSPDIPIPQATSSGSVAGARTGPVAAVVAAAGVSTAADAWAMDAVDAAASSSQGFGGVADDQGAPGARVLNAAGPQPAAPTVQTGSASSAAGKQPQPAMPQPPTVTKGVPLPSKPAPVPQRPPVQQAAGTAASREEYWEEDPPTAGTPMPVPDWLNPFKPKPKGGQSLAFATGPDRAQQQPTKPASPGPIQQQQQTQQQQKQPEPKKQGGSGWLGLPFKLGSGSSSSQASQPQASKPPAQPAAQAPAATQQGQQQGGWFGLPFKFGGDTQPPAPAPAPAPSKNQNSAAPPSLPWFGASGLPQLPGTQTNPQQQQAMPGRQSATSSGIGAGPNAGINTRSGSPGGMLGSASSGVAQPDGTFSGDEDEDDFIVAESARRMFEQARGSLSPGRTASPATGLPTAQSSNAGRYSGAPARGGQDQQWKLNGREQDREGGKQGQAGGNKGQGGGLEDEGEGELLELTLLGPIKPQRTNVVFKFAEDEGSILNALYELSGEAPVKRSGGPSSPEPSDSPSRSPEPSWPAATGSTSQPPSAPSVGGFVAVGGMGAGTGAEKAESAATRSPSPGLEGQRPPSPGLSDTISDANAGRPPSPGLQPGAGAAATGPGAAGAAVPQVQGQVPGDVAGVVQGIPIGIPLAAPPGGAFPSWPTWGQPIAFAAPAPPGFGVPPGWGNPAVAPVPPASTAPVPRVNGTAVPGVAVPGVPVALPVGWGAPGVVPSPLMNGLQADGAGHAGQQQSAAMAPPATGAATQAPTPSQSYATQQVASQEQEQEIQVHGEAQQAPTEPQAPEQAQTQVQAQQPPAAAEPAIQPVQATQQQGVAASSSSASAQKNLQPPLPALGMHANVPPLFDGQVLVQLSMPYQAKEHEVVKFVGDRPEFGSWNAESALALSWAPGELWVAYSALWPGQYQFKPIIYNTLTRGSVWEPGPMRTLTVPQREGGGTLTLSCVWGDAGRTECTFYYCEPQRTPDGSLTFQLQQTTCDRLTDS